MSSVTSDSINDDYYWGNYFDLKVIIMKENGYINATRLYKDNNKRFDNWLRRESSKQLVNEISKLTNNLQSIKTKKYKKVKRDSQIHESKNYTLDDIINIVKVRISSCDERFK
jgi:KilA-N domain